MKLMMSPKGHPKGRHVILQCDKRESYEAHAVICQEVLSGAARPVREETERGNVLYRFNMRYLDTLWLAFPMAELSPVITRRMQKAEEKRLAGMEVPKIKIPGYSGWKLDYQMIGTGAILNGDIDLLNDEMGLGKTFQVLNAIAVLARRAEKKGKHFSALVVCPNSAKYTWLEAIEDYYETLTGFVVEGDKATRQVIIQKGHDTHGGVVILNWEGLNAKPVHQTESKYSPIVGYEYRNEEAFEHTWDYFCSDEHHRAKNPQAQVTRGFFQISANRELHMSGTPILNRPEEIWPVLHRLYPEQFDHYEPFVRSIAIMGEGTTPVAYRPAPMAELRKFLQQISLRRRKDQVLDNLPEVIHLKRRVELTKEGRKLYNEIAEEMRLRMEDGSIRDIRGALPQIIRLKQACFSPELYGGAKLSPKIVELKAIVKELVENGEKALIFSQWSRATRIIQRELANYNPAYVTGEVPAGKKRQEQIRKFKNDPKCHVYIGTVDANREAINLGNATYVIFTDDGWTPAGKDQAIGRSAAGGLRGVDVPEGTKVHVITIQAEDTFEDRIEKLLKRKRALFDRLVERDGGRKIEQITLDDIKDLI